jgi:hypothetical protein
MNTVMSIAEDSIVGSAYVSAGLVSGSLGLVTKGITGFYPCAAAISYAVFCKYAFNAYIISYALDRIQNRNSYFEMFFESLTITEKSYLNAKNSALFTGKIALFSFLLQPWVEKLDNFGDSCLKTTEKLLSCAKDRFSNIQQNLIIPIPGNNTNPRK